MSLQLDLYSCKHEGIKKRMRVKHEDKIMIYELCSDCVEFIADFQTVEIIKFEAKK